MPSGGYDPQGRRKEEHGIGKGCYTGPWRVVRACLRTECWAKAWRLSDASPPQSSCNLTVQAEAKKAKKSLNIIHIGNICEPPSLLTPCSPDKVPQNLPARV